MYLYIWYIKFQVFDSLCRPLPKLGHAELFFLCLLWPCGHARKYGVNKAAQLPAAKPERTSKPWRQSWSNRTKSNRAMWELLPTKNLGILS